MAERTVDDRNAEGKRSAAPLSELRTALDGVVRDALLEAGRLGLEQALEADRSDCGAANAPACGRCGGAMRYAGREHARHRTDVAHAL